MGFLTNISGTNTPAFTSNSGIPALYDTQNKSTAPSNEVKIISPNAIASANFGASVAVGNGFIVVGAPYETNAEGTNAGCAYVFNLSGTYIRTLRPTDLDNSDNFGCSVAVGCGRIVVGAEGVGPNSTGAAYIFHVDGTQVTKLTSPASSSDGFVFFGGDVAVGCGRIVVSSTSADISGTANAGSAHIYDLNGNLIRSINASDYAAADVFGNPSIGCDRIVIGSVGDDPGGSAYIYDLDGYFIKKITADGSGENFGWNAVKNGRIVVGARNAAVMYIYDLNGNLIVRKAGSDTVVGDLFGNNVAIGNGRIVVGSAFNDNALGTDAGAAYVFDLDGNQITKLTASDGSLSDYFGDSVAVGNGRIVVGSPYDDNANGTDAGAVYIYTTPNVVTAFDAKEYTIYGD